MDGTTTTMRAMTHDHGGAGHVHGAASGPMLWISLVVTMAFIVGEYIAGRRANSLALISDAGHNLSDALALGLAAYAVWDRPQARDRPQDVWLPPCQHPDRAVQRRDADRDRYFHPGRSLPPVSRPSAREWNAHAVGGRCRRADEYGDSISAARRREGEHEHARRLCPHGGRRAFLSGRLDCRGWSSAPQAGDTPTRPYPC